MHESFQSNTHNESEIEHNNESDSIESSNSIEVLDATPLLGAINFIKDAAGIEGPEIKNPDPVIEQARLEPEEVKVLVRGTGGFKALSLKAEEQLQLQMLHSRVEEALRVVLDE